MAQATAARLRFVGCPNRASASWAVDVGTAQAVVKPRRRSIAGQDDSGAPRSAFAMRCALATRSSSRDSRVCNHPFRRPVLRQRIRGRGRV